MRLATRLLFSGLLTLSVFLFASLSSSQARTTGICTVATEAATSVTSTSAVLHGSTKDCGVSGTYTFDYGKTTGYGSTTSAATVTSTTDSAATISGLSPSTTYHFRFRWSGSGTPGGDRTFTTSAASSGGGGGTESADVGVTKTASAASVRVGSKVTFTMVVKNHGTADAIGVTLTDALPAGLTLVSATTTKGSCSGSSTIFCTIGSLGNGSSATVTIVVTAAVAGAIKNTAEIGATNPDPNVGANNRSSVTVTVGSGGTPPPGAGPPVPRSISMSVGRTSASGRVSAGGFGACFAGVKVELQRQKGSTWVKAGSGRTTASGKYSLKHSAVAGLYRARAPELMIGDRRCLAATSRSARTP